MHGLWLTGCGLTPLHFIPQGHTVTAECSITKILEKEVKTLSYRRARKTKAFHEQKQCEGTSFKMAHQVIRRKQSRSGARKTSRILAKKIGGQQIHLILTPISSKPMEHHCRSLRKDDVDKSKNVT